jgi:hypothetical protein
MYNFIINNFLGWCLIFLAVIMDLFSLFPTHAIVWRRRQQVLLWCWYSSSCVLHCFLFIFFFCKSKFVHAHLHFHVSSVIHFQDICLLCFPLFNKLLQVIINLLMLWSLYLLPALTYFLCTDCIYIFHMSFTINGLFL